MATTYRIEGVPKYFTYDEIMEALSEYLGEEILQMSLERVIDIATEEAKEKIRNAVVKMFARSAVSSYLPIIGWLFNGTMTALDIYEFGKDFLEFVDLAGELRELGENEEMMIRLDTIYWESGTSNSWTKRAVWVF